MKCMAGATVKERLMPQQLLTAKAVEGGLFHDNTLAHRYLTILEALSGDTLLSVDANPIEYTYPYYHLLAVEVFARLQRQSFLLEQQQRCSQFNQISPDPITELTDISDLKTDLLI
jgi:hypothetical protein